MASPVHSYERIQTIGRDEFFSYSPAQQTRIRNVVRAKLMEAMGTKNIVVRWDGCTPTNVTTDVLEERLDDDVRKKHKHGLTKAHSRKLCERQMQQLEQKLRFSIPVHTLQQGAYASLLTKGRLLKKLYDVKDWRIQWDASSAGYTSVTLAPLWGDQSSRYTENLLPQHLWRLAVWWGKETAGFDEWKEASSFVEEVTAFSKECGRVRFISDWEGVRSFSHVASACHTCNSVSYPHAHSAVHSAEFPMSTMRICLCSQYCPQFHLSHVHTSTELSPRAEYPMSTVLSTVLNIPCQKC